ncbi:MAG: hypothetical protein ACJA08_003173 [Cyclobacteriaceae bacterium]|jgi:hypothetical protein
MKRLLEKLFFAGLLVSTVAVISCGEDDETTPDVAQPSISVVLQVNGQSATTAQHGDSISFVITAQATGGINRIYTTSQSFVGFDKNRTDLGLDAGDTNTSINLGLTGSPVSTDVGSTWEAVFIVVDEVNQADSTTVTVDIVSPDAKVYSATLLYAQLASEDSKTFFSTNLGTTITKNEVDASAEPSSIDVDFGFAGGVSGSVWLASPANYPTFAAYNLSIWTTKNTTTFKKVELTNEAYLAINSSADVAAIFTGSTATTADRVTDFVVGNVFALQLDATNKGGKYAVVKITSIVDGNSNGSMADSVDYVEIEVIVQD